MRGSLLVALFGACLAVAVGGCAASDRSESDGSAGGGGGGGGDASGNAGADLAGADLAGTGGDTDLGCATTLTAVSAANPALAAGAAADLRVKLADCKGPVVGGTVKFAVGAGAAGSALSSLSSQTDGKGEAVVSLTAGQTSATFDVTASADPAKPVVFHVTVAGPTVGALDVGMSYAGKQAFVNYQILLFEGQVCANLDRYNLPKPALASSAVLKAITDHAAFPGLTPAKDYTLVVTAKILSGQMTGYGCLDTVNVPAGAATPVTIQVADIPIAFLGLYKLDNRFDLSNALPPSVAAVVQAFYEMTNDKGEPGQNGHPQCDPNAPAPRYCGTDPAAFLLDFVYRQLCRWECLIGEDFNTCSQLNHPSGDISACYTQSLGAWTKSVSRFTGACTAIQVLNPKVEPALATQISNFAPAIVTNILNIAGDLSTAIVKMHIGSELLIGQRLEKQGNYTHTLKTLYVDVHSWSDPTKITTYPVDLRAAGLTVLAQSGSATGQNGVLTIPAHALQLDFSKLLWYLYSSVILPAASPPGQMWTKTEDMLKGLVNCNRCNPQVGAAGLGCTLSMNINSGGLFTDVDYENFCDLGLTAAGVVIDNQIRSLIQTQTIFTLHGTAQADMVNAQQVADALKNGQWDGQWTEGMTTGNFPGTFTGMR
jgi:hypothetical protein